MIDRAGLAEFLRRRRAALSPAEVGLPPGLRRRTPGLRRDEIAGLAGMSTDYYTRLEQARGPHPSPVIAAALARALRLDLDERDHLFDLLDLTPPPRRAGGHIRPGLISLADRLTDVPVCICSDLDAVLWQNGLADSVLGPLAPDPSSRERIFTWTWFTEPAVRERFPEEDWPHHSVAHVNDLRAVYSRRGRDRLVVDLVNDLRARSAEFTQLWEQHDVLRRRFDRKRMIHPEVGLLHLTCEVLLTPEEDVRLLVFFPTPGTDAREKLDLLRVIGTQDLAPSAPRESGRQQGLDQ